MIKELCLFLSLGVLASAFLTEGVVAPAAEVQKQIPEQIPEQIKEPIVPAADEAQPVPESPVDESKVPEVTPQVATVLRDDEAPVQLVPYAPVPPGDIIPQSVPVVPAGGESDLNTADSIGYGYYGGRRGGWGGRGGGFGYGGGFGGGYGGGWGGGFRGGWGGRGGWRRGYYF